MSVVVIDPPASFLDLDVVKGHLRVEGGAEDATITLYAAAACGHLDGPDGALGRCIGQQKLELHLSNLGCGVIELQGRPVRSVESVKFKDGDGVEQTLAAEVYQLENGAARPVVRFHDLAWAVAIDEANPVRVTYLAGYESGRIPKPLEIGALMLAGELYARRDLGGEIKLEGAVEALIAPYRVWES